MDSTTSSKIGIHTESFLKITLFIVFGALLGHYVDIILKNMKNENDMIKYLTIQTIINALLLYLIYSYSVENIKIEQVYNHIIFIFFFFLMQDNYLSTMKDFMNKYNKLNKKQKTRGAKQPLSRRSDSNVETNSFYNN